jgi:hypothetical protein
MTEAGFAARNITVQFKDKSNSVLTNKDGGFTILAKKLPDTLIFSAPGFEPYKVVVTEKTIKDPDFAIVLLNSRVRVSSPAEVHTDLNKVAGLRADGLVTYSEYHTTASGEYLKGKKLFMSDTVPAGSDVLYKSGLLTAGEINDFNKWKMWQDYNLNEFNTWSRHWDLYTDHRYSVLVQNKDRVALGGQPVFLLNKNNADTIWKAVTDNTGKAELWADLDHQSQSVGSLQILCGNETLNTPIEFAAGINQITLNRSCDLSNTVDIAFVVDATGSMGDEIDYLKLELEDVIRTTFSLHSDLDLHMASVFYRDEGDEYLSRHVDFQTDLLKVLNFMKLQRAGGGGDMPEAVNTALSVAIDTLHWDADARSKILFLVLDAPPHDAAKKDMYRLIQKAAAKGIRIIPVVCSGAEKSTEFIMRSIALATNGSYVFLTDNSNIGETHIKPTTDAFKMEFLNKLLQRIIGQMVITDHCGQENTITQVADKPEQDVKVYPNPTHGKVTIQTKIPLKEFFVCDFTGKILMRQECNEKQNKYELNFANYPSGIYLIRYATPAMEWGEVRVVVVR